jgi:hypothetical protein
MADRSDYRSPAEPPAQPVTSEERDALRHAASSSLPSEPARDPSGLEIWVRETEWAIWIYRDPSAAQAALSEAVADTPAVSRELEALGGAARTLARRLGELGDAAQASLLATDALDARALDTLRVLGGVAAGACDQAARGGADEAEEVVLADEVSLIERLAVVWVEHTGETIEEDRAGRGGFARYVETACSIVGLGAEDAHRVRVRVSRTMGLLESADMLASLPED